MNLACFPWSFFGGLVDFVTRVSSAGSQAQTVYSISHSVIGSGLREILFSADVAPKSPPNSKANDGRRLLLTVVVEST